MISPNRIVDEHLITFCWYCFETVIGSSLFVGDLLSFAQKKHIWWLAPIFSLEDRFPIYFGISVPYLFPTFPVNSPRGLDVEITVSLRPSPQAIGRLLARTDVNEFQRSFIVHQFFLAKFWLNFEIGKNHGKNWEKYWKESSDHHHFWGDWKESPDHQQQQQHHHRLGIGKIYVHIHMIHQIIMHTAIEPDQKQGPFIARGSKGMMWDHGPSFLGMGIGRKRLTLENHNHIHVSGISNDSLTWTKCWDTNPY